MDAGANWFIALPVTAGELPAGIVEDLPPGLARLHPADLHITVAFLGAIGERRAHASWAETAAIESGPFVLPTGAPAALGRPTRPSAYGLDLVAGDEFAGWLAHWRDRLRAAAGIERETRAVRPHVTLARPPRRGGTVIRERARAWLENAAPGSTILHLDRLALYTAAEGAGRRRYRQVQARPLPAKTEEAG